MISLTSAMDSPTCWVPERCCWMIIRICRAEPAELDDRLVASSVASTEAVVAAPTEAQEAQTLGAVIIIPTETKTTLILQTQTPTRTQVLNLTKKAQRPVRMFQMTRAPVTGRKAARLLIVVTPWCAAGSTRSFLVLLVPERLASLIKNT